MRIVVDYPPLYEEIREAFPQVEKMDVLFAWGDKIYNPSDSYISHALREHERVHGFQQGDDIEAWWRQYIEDEKFRLEMELAAHYIEWKTMCEDAWNRSQRRAMLKIVGAKLASPLYGKMVKRRKTAMKLIKDMDNEHG